MTKEKKIGLGSRRQAHRRDIPPAQARASNSQKSDDIPMEEDEIVKCVYCDGKTTSNAYSLKTHNASREHRESYITNPEYDALFKNKVRLHQSAFKNNIALYSVDLIESKAKSHVEVLDEHKEIIKKLYEFELFNNGNLKAQIIVHSVHENPVKLCQVAENEEPDPNNIVETREIQPKYHPCTEATDFDDFFNNQKESIDAKADELEQRGSGWTISSFSHLILSITTYDALRGSSWIPTPAKIKNTGGVINIQNDNDNM